MAAVAAFLSALTDTQKALTAFIGAVSFGIVIGVSTIGLLGLPDDVAANTEFRETHSREYRALVCLLQMSQERRMEIGENPIILEGECGL